MKIKIIDCPINDSSDYDYLIDNALHNTLRDHFKISEQIGGDVNFVKTYDDKDPFSLRLVGDDVCYTERPGKTSPPFPNHNMNEGDKLRSDWFPILLPSGS